MEKRMTPFGDELSILGFGCMRFPTKMGLIDEAQALPMIHKAIEGGVNYFDTAYFYHGGQSESFLGKALAGGLRERVKIATKMPPWLSHSQADMIHIFETQLKRLQTHYIDYYLLHALNEENWNKFLALDVFSLLEKWKQEGKILQIGFSFHGDRDLFKTIIDAYKWDFCQIQYNLLDEYIQAGTEGLNYAYEKGLAVFVMEPLRGGALAKKQPKAVQALYSQCDTQRTAVEWALRWIWNHKEVTLLLSGMSEMGHVVNNISYASLKEGDVWLTQGHQNMLSRVQTIYKEGQRIPCTACQYCMPCPVGVDIPRCFELYNSKYLLDQKVTAFYWMQLGGLNGKAAHASLCVNCGKCVQKCPQSIAIPQSLKIVEKDLEGKFMVPLLKVGKRVLKAFKKK